jgi:hypothetical protein
MGTKGWMPKEEEHRIDKENESLHALQMLFIAHQ